MKSSASMQEKITAQIGAEFEKLRWSAGKVKVDFLHQATNSEVEGVKGFPYPLRYGRFQGAGNRESRQLFDAEGRPRFRDDPILDVEGKPIVNSAGDAFDVVMPASRQIFFEGSQGDITKLDTVVSRAGTVLAKMGTEYSGLSEGWSFSAPSHYFWFLLFEIAWRGDHPLIDAKRQIWLPDASNVTLPYDLNALRQINQAGFGLIAGKIPANWLTRLPDAWMSSIDDAVAACQDAWGLFQSNTQRDSTAAIQEDPDTCVASGSVSDCASSATVTVSKGGISMSKRFAVALSFPGARRGFIKEVVNCLVPVLDKHRVLYDEFYNVEFAIRDLDVYLPGLYRDDSDLIVVFACTEYAEREWCGLEYRAIRDLLKDQSRSPFSVLTLKFDESKLAGELSIDGYLTISGLTPRDVADCILKRLIFCKDAAR